MQKVHLIALRNNEVTQNNMQIALENELWGMQKKGKHEQIRNGDTVIFLIGISIHNLTEVRMDERYRSGFPNFTNELIDDDHFISTFIFNAEQAVIGDVTSDYFEQNIIVWAPQESKAGKLNYFPHRFQWKHIATNTDVKLSVSNTSSLFLADVIRALRDKGAQPSSLSESQFDSFLTSLNIVATQVDEETYQMKADSTIGQVIPNGKIQRKPQKIKISESESWNRDPNIAALAIKSANHKCIINQEHQTFTSKVSNKNFVEAHHLIPMEFQDDFLFSIDVPENILVLCPNCHRRLHHAEWVEVSELLTKFWKEREFALNSRGINTTSEELERFYK